MKRLLIIALFGLIVEVFGFFQLNRAMTGKVPLMSYRKENPGRYTEIFTTPIHICKMTSIPSTKDEPAPEGIQGPVSREGMISWNAPVVICLLLILTIFLFRHRLFTKITSTI